MKQEFEMGDWELLAHIELGKIEVRPNVDLGDMFSGSFQNQVISAIKTYYEISGNGRIVPQFLERPRRSRAVSLSTAKLIPRSLTAVLRSHGIWCLTGG